MKVLVIVEHDNIEIKPSTLNCVSAAKLISDDIELIVFGHDCKNVVSTSEKIENIKKVNVFQHKIFSHTIAESVSLQLNSFLEKNQYTHILAPSTTFGKNLLPRISAMLDVQQISDVTKIIDHETFERPIYAGNAIMTVKSNDDVKILTVRSTCFEQSKFDSNSADINECETDVDFENKSEFVKHELSDSDRPELTSAKVVISGGRGMQNGDNFKLLEGIADKLGAAVGASRAAVDAGFVPNDWQVGQTGKIVAPDLYIAVGISGAIQHIAGIKDSKFIVAVNKDEEAPIFKFSDYGLVGDLFEVLPKLEAKL
ncbi:MAG: electron transfer flavoprotein subunit alpha [Rickettsiales bacterium]|nr:electron transfer flavoprotein subunit alpha [Rickettsiales bacterium]OUV54528.1 MAG: electron transfer flavoprotein subunit alpha [Rickettsiales bacterium TMED127]|tara:strand:- start:50265 stop:51203 length:939 start_codon:yes stop_codon:yes gene_type:complete